MSQAEHPAPCAPRSARPTPGPGSAGTPLAMVLAVVAGCVLAACGPDDATDKVAAAAASPTASVTPRPAAPTAERQAPAAPRAVFGQVSTIEPIRSAGSTSGTGAVVGGVLGAVVGNQIGGGNGRAAATVLGGVGGAVLGNQVEKRRNDTVVGYRVHVRLDDGGSRSFERQSLGGLDVGSRVRVDGGRLSAV